MAGMELPPGFNDWDKDTKHEYFEAVKSVAQQAIAASEAQKAIAASEAQKAIAASDAQKAIAASEAQKAAALVDLKRLELDLEETRTKRSSVGKADAVFLFLLVHGARYEVSGTAFAISDTLVLTAYHNFSSGRGGEHHLECAISSKATKVDGLLVPAPVGGCISLKLLHFDESDDWALFRRLGDGTFSTTLQICPQADLPNPSSDVLVRQYYYSLGLLNNSTISDLCIWSDSTTLLQYDEGGKFAILKRGKTAGSSGSPAVTSDGKVFGMHLDSFNETVIENSGGGGAGGGGEAFPSLPPAPPTKKSRRQLPTIDQAEREIESTSDLSGLSELSYASFSRCLVLASISELMEAVSRATDGSCK